MKWIKLFEDFKLNNVGGNLISVDDPNDMADLIKCIKSRGVIYADIVHDYPDNDPEKPLSPVDIDKDGLITVEINNNEYTVDFKDVKRIEYDSSE